MKVLLVHNYYAQAGGEDEAVRRLKSVLESNGNTVEMFERDSTSIGDSLVRKIAALGSGIHSESSKGDFGQTLQRFRPDVIQVQNLYPLISPSILRVAWESGVPVVMRCPNYRLTCPTGLHLRDGEVCTLCLDCSLRSCVTHNCTGDWTKSLGYAVRTWAAQSQGVFHKYVSQFIVLSEFQRKWFLRSGFSNDSLSVLPNMPKSVVAQLPPMDGGYVGFVGRLSPEKGIDTLVDAARLCPEVQFRVAGAGPSRPVEHPPNISFLGHLSGVELERFYAEMRVLVCPSTCFEGFPGVIVDAMRYCKPVVCSNIGGMPEFIENGTTGLLAEPRNPLHLAQAIRQLWNSPNLVQSFGEAGHERLLTHYAPQSVYAELLNIYGRAARRRVAADNHGHYRGAASAPVEVG